MELVRKEYFQLKKKNLKIQEFWFFKIVQEKKTKNPTPEIVIEKPENFQKKQIFC